MGLFMDIATAAVLSLCPTQMTRLFAWVRSETLGCILRFDSPHTMRITAVTRMGAPETAARVRMVRTGKWADRSNSIHAANRPSLGWRVRVDECVASKETARQSIATNLWIGNQEYQFQPIRDESSLYVSGLTCWRKMTLGHAHADVRWQISGGSAHLGHAGGHLPSGWVYDCRA